MEFDTKLKFILLSMRKLFILFAAAALIFVGGCSEEYDDSALNGRVDNLENRVAKLEELCRQMNTNISSLQTLVTALQNNDYVTGVTPVTNNGQEIGYTITFSKSAPITIYHGKNGKDGANGADGKDGIDGTDGKDGHTPVIGVRRDTDGIYYWTLDGDWLLDGSGNKIKAEGRDGKDGQDGQDGAPGQNGSDGQDGADGKDGITPQLKIENGYWFVSTDNGATWTNLGRATGENGKDGADGQDGKDGDSFFQNVDTSNSEYVIFTLADGTTIKLPTWYAFEQLRTLCNQMNTNISSLQTVVNALQNNDYITACTPLMEERVQIGYTITFAKSGPIVIYHGQNGKDGNNGTDDSNGADGHSPMIGAKTDTDGVIYWTLDGEWLTDESGSKIPVHGRDGADGSNGSDGITPQLKIEGGYWYISYDNGTTWTQLGKATGENGADGKDGADGKSFFQDVTQDADYVYLTLSTDEQIAVPKHHPLSITFDKTDEICVLPNQTYSIGYTLTGADDHTVVKALAQDGFRAVVKKTDNATGTIEITTPETLLSSEVLVFVSDGKERTIMRSINFVEGIILITTKSYTVDNAGGTVEIDLSTNIDYTVEIPEADKAWISVAKIETRAVMRNESITLDVAPNPAQTPRYSEVRLVDAFGVTGETILIIQKAAVYFPDANFKAYMVANFDKNKNGEISEYEASLIKSISCSNMNIQSLEGIQYCTALTFLDCSNNQLTTLDVSQNTALTFLNCNSNQLTALDVSNNTVLEQLWCAGNQLTALDVSKNTALTDLVCAENPLTALDVSKNTALTELYCSENQLTSLDVSQNTALTSLYCFYNQLTALDVSKNTALTTLDCSGNQLTTLDVSKTNLGNSTEQFPLNCNITTLQTLYLKTGWQINGINKNRSTNRIPDQTEIRYKD